MDQSTFSQWVPIILAITCVLGIVVIFLEKKKNQRLSQRLIQLTTTLEMTRKQLDTLQEKHDKIIEFQNSLNVAELTTMLQKPRLNAQSIDTGKTLQVNTAASNLLRKKACLSKKSPRLWLSPLTRPGNLIHLAKLARNVIGRNELNLKDREI